MRALNDCVTSLPRESLKKVTRIGVSGQMHGVIFWKKNQGCHWINSGNLRVFEPRDTSYLITWEDGRCNTDFLASLPQPQSHLSLATGFGCATIFWYLRNRPDFLDSYDAAGTIQDYVVAMLCGLQRPQMSVHNATSWGYFSTRSKTWNIDILRGSGFPVHLLPAVVNAGCVAGKTSYEWCGICQGTEVGIALGDFQCSVYSSATESTDAGLAIPSSASLYTRVIAAGLSQHETHLTIDPTLFGERHTPDRLASVSNITAAELSLGHATRALCHGIVQNLHSMLPSSRLQESGVRRIIGSGSALSRNDVLRQEVEKIFPFPVLYGKDTDSALGAAMVMVKQW
ncbi:hypothetical protein XENTR_v10005061 [Xenopus tropicalis]|nr:hypothetical protein XENTR_v10005061 [Xenopus tropicalis]